jgi:hypothetical protein
MQQMLQQLLANQSDDEAKDGCLGKKIDAGTNATRVETEAMRDKRIEGNRDDRKERTSFHEATETEPYPGMMQSIQEHQEIPKE